MSLFYSGRHRAVSTHAPGRRTGLGVAAIAAAGIAAPVMVASGATASPATVETGTTNTTFTGTVTIGARGNTVKAIQRKVGTTADGVFGSKTLAAVKRYQSRNGLVADGVVGRLTAAKMGLGSSSGGSTGGSSGSSGSTTNFTGLVRQGARGDIVKQIQRKVGTTADGVFGAQTAAAVKRWQKSNGLTADGVVGPKTGSRMGLTGSSSGGSGGGSSKPAPSKPSNPGTSGVTSTAAKYVGAPYRMGGTTPSGWDCSGFTSYVFRQHGKSLPRTAEAQRQAASKVSSPKPGDLVFFGSPAYHVGIYAGNGQMYDAGNSRVHTSKRAIWTSAVTYGRV